jgi:AraC family transcriptional regulator
MHVVLLLGGRYVSDARGMPAVCDEPAVLLNPPGTEHRDRFRARDGRELDGLFLTLTMPARAYERLCDGVARDDAPRRLSRPALARAMQLLREVRTWDDASPLAIESTVGELIDDARTHTASVARDDGLAHALDRLEADTLPPPSIEELARIAQYHPVAFARAFRRRHGMSPSDWLRMRRLHRAVSLIARGQSLADAAATLGFVDQSHLHRSFVAEFGMTPGAFRRLALGRPTVSRIQDARLRPR